MRHHSISGAAAAVCVLAAWGQVMAAEGSGSPTGHPAPPLLPHPPPPPSPSMTPPSSAPAHFKQDAGSQGTSLLSDTPASTPYPPLGEPQLPGSVSALITACEVLLGAQNTAANATTVQACLAALLAWDGQTAGVLSNITQLLNVDEDGGPLGAGLKGGRNGWQWWTTIVLWALLGFLLAYAFGNIFVNWRFACSTHEHILLYRKADAWNCFVCWYDQVCPEFRPRSTQSTRRIGVSFPMHGEKSKGSRTLVRYRVGLLPQNSREVLPDENEIPILTRVDFEFAVPFGSIKWGKSPSKDFIKPGSEPEADPYDAAPYDAAYQDQSVDGLRSMHSALGVATLTGVMAACVTNYTSELSCSAGSAWCQINAYLTCFIWPLSVAAFLLVVRALREIHRLYLVSNVNDHIRRTIIAHYQRHGISGDLTHNSWVLRTRTIVSGRHLISSHASADPDASGSTSVGSDNGGLGGWYKCLGGLRSSRFADLVLNMGSATDQLWTLSGTYMLALVLQCVILLWARTTNWGGVLDADQISVRNSLASTALFVSNAALTFTVVVAFKTISSWSLQRAWLNDAFTQNTGICHADGHSFLTDILEVPWPFWTRKGWRIWWRDVRRNAFLMTGVSTWYHNTRERYKQDRMHPHAGSPNPTPWLIPGVKPCDSEEKTKTPSESYLQLSDPSKG